MTTLHIIRPKQDLSKPLAAPVRVGKDILGLLSTAMYTEPLAIIREYVQNSADSIDLAYQAELLSSRKPGRVDLVVDPSARSLTIRDNGLGIEGQSVEEILVAFGLSHKRGTGARGFRGVGRLGGLGFAQEVVFRTRSLRDERITEVTWDCRALRTLLVESQTTDLTDAVRRVVSVRSIADDSQPKHFFEVQLCGVTRVRNDRLLNESAITKYLAQVAPVPFVDAFKYGAQMSQFLKKHFQRRPVVLLVNGNGPVTRPHRNTFPIGGAKKDRFNGLKTFTIDGLNGGTAAAGWILHHKYLGALKASPEIRGLRARHGDMQIGEEQLFTSLFAEARFSGWVVGEIHVLDPAILPNARRDDFEPNAAYSHVLNRLGPFAAELGQQCRSNSECRTRLHKFERLELEVQETARRIRTRIITGRRADAARREALETIKIMERLLPRCVQTRAEEGDLQTRLHGAKSLLGRATEEGKELDPLELLPKSKRAMLEGFVQALIDSATNKSAASLLADKIVRRVVKQHVNDSAR